MASTTLSLTFRSPITPSISHKHHHHHHHQQQQTSSLSTCLSAKFHSITATSSFQSLSPIISRPNFSSTVARFSESEAPPVVVTDDDDDTTSSSLVVASESVEIADISESSPNREEIFAVVMVGSRQYIVFPGRFIYTQRLKGANVNDKIILSKVLLIGTKTSTYIGKPVVVNAAVHAVVEEQGLNDKVVVFKYKRKKNYRRNIGHRQPNTRIRITGITGYEDAPVVTLPVS